MSSQDSQSRASWGHSGLKTKRGSPKQEKRNPIDSPHTHRKDNLSRPLEVKDSKVSRIKESEVNDAKNYTCHVSQENQFQKPEVRQETVKLNKPENRKAARREPPGPEQDAPVGRKQDDEQEEKKRKRKSDVMEGFRLKHLEKSVSIRLVDIRNCDSKDFKDEGVTRRNNFSLDENIKLRGAVLADATTANKANGWLRKAPANGSHTPSRPAAGHLKSWGKFRIPKRSERITDKEEEDPLLRPLTNTPSQPRTRLRTGTDDGEVEPCLKRCHSHQLRGDSSLGRRYGSDIIRRGVLAS